MKAKLNVKTAALLLITMVAVIAAFVHAPVPQDPRFHDFADQRTIMDIPHFWNVVSNIPFIVVGAAGMLWIAFRGRHTGLGPLYANGLLFFAGILLTGIGSSYYHHAPDNQTLVWDRLPMTVSFMAFFSIIIGAYISPRAAALLLWPLILTGLLSVAYWHLTENKGHGDLRLYFLVQFLPMLLIPLVLLLYRRRGKFELYLWLVILAYAVAKVLEAADHSIFGIGHVISGHTLKHVFSALAPALFLIVIGRHSLLAGQNQPTSHKL